MNSSVYEAVAYAMRYWFVFVIFVVLVAVIYVSYKEYKQRKNVMEEIENFLGYVEVVRGNEDIIGLRYSFTDENTIGRSQSSDIYLDDKSVYKSHALLYEKNGDIYLTPMGRAKTAVNSRKIIKSCKLKTGDIVTLGNVSLRVFIKRTRLSDDY